MPGALRVSWECLGATWGVMGMTCGYLGCHGSTLEMACSAIGVSFRCHGDALTVSWGAIGCCEGVMGLSWGYLQCVRGTLVGNWGVSWTFKVKYWARMKRYWEKGKGRLVEW